MNITGEVGILWSITIEAAGLWLWWQRYTLLACATSCILITGPILGLALPLQQSITQNQAIIQQHSKQLSVAEQTIIQLKASLNSYQLTSQTRMGWASRIDNTQHELNIANQRFNQLLSTALTQPNISKAIAIISIESLALLVLLLTQILIVRKLRNVSIPMPRNGTIPETNPNAPTELLKNTVHSLSVDRNEQNDDDTMALQVAEHLSNTLHKEEISQAEWGRRNDVSAKNISLLLNFRKRKKLGLEGISKREVKRIHNLMDA